MATRRASFRRSLLATALAVLTAGAREADFGESTYRPPAGLVRGGAFIDRFLPVPVQGPLEANVWGAANVVPREVKNGIEDATFSYWGGNILRGSDGQEHLFVCRWREDSPRGHATWSRSEVVHAVAASPLGPFKVVAVIGKGHNPEIYRTKDGDFIIGVIGGAYRAPTLDGPWTWFETVLTARTEPVNRTNKTYVAREDGSVLMVNKAGHVWISATANERFTQVTDRSVYPPIQGAHFEDPVIWRDEVQYNLIVNDWFTRTAFYLRSPDGLHWTWDHGVAYDPTIMRHEDGTTEKWHKFERPKVRQDGHGRATHMNFAVIDVMKDDDKGGDNHSSKNVVIPLTVPRRLQILDDDAITSDTPSIRVRILAEPGFDPQTDVDRASLRFGAPGQVDLGRGCRAASANADGADLTVTFAGQDHGITGADFAAKLLGSTPQGALLFGYARLRPLDPASRP